MTCRKPDARTLERLQREASRRAFAKWFVEPEPQGPASLATVQPGKRARRFIHYV